MNNSDYSEPDRRAVLAQRMHDDLCQQLAAAALWQEILVRQLEGMTPPPPKAVEQAREVGRLLDAAMTEARALMRDLRAGEDQP